MTSKDLCFPMQSGFRGCQECLWAERFCYGKRGYFETCLTLEQGKPLGTEIKPKSVPQYQKLGRFSIVKEGKQLN